MAWLTPAENLAWFSAMLALNLAPGPNMLFAFASGVAGGRHRGVFAALGSALGLLIHVSLAATVTAAVVRLEPAFLNGMRLAGAVYLVWLGARALGSAPAAFRATGSQGSVRGVFVRGAVTSLTNPKPVVFFVAFLPQFVEAEYGSVVVQMLMLGTIFTASATAVNASVGWAGGLLERLMTRRPGLARWPGRVAGATMLVLGAGLLMDTAR